MRSKENTLFFRPSRRKLTPLYIYSSISIKLLIEYTYRGGENLLLLEKISYYFSFMIFGDRFTKRAFEFFKLDRISNFSNRINKHYENLLLKNFNQCGGVEIFSRGTTKGKKKDNTVAWCV